MESPPGQDPAPTGPRTAGSFSISASTRKRARTSGCCRMDGDRKPWVFLKTSFDERWGEFSPDGRWVAYMSNESGRMEIYIRPFVEASNAGRCRGRPPPWQWQVSTAGGIYPRWRPDGKELYYIGPNGEMMAAPITATGTTLEPGAPVALFPHADLRRRRGQCPGPAIRRHPRRPLPDQHGPGRDVRSHHAHPELESRTSEVTLTPGARLGSYEVTSLIGQRGMGEVYRACDRKLDHDVAVKVLPDLFAATSGC